MAIYLRPFDGKVEFKYNHPTVTFSRRTIISKWETMRHNGVAFPPEYEPRGLTTNIRNNNIRLEPLQEEMLMAWAKKIGTPYVQDPIFQENFLSSLRERWPDLFQGTTIADIDFGGMQQIADREKLANLPPEERKKVSAERKRVREELQAKYGRAEVDGIEVEIGAYLVEPPGIFMGRGAHPLRGRWKRRVLPEDVELNLDEAAPVPQPMYGGQWRGIVHEHDGLWIARWKDELSDKIKYVWLAETSHLRQEREKEKFVKANNLRGNLEKVREEIREKMKSPNERTRKVATVAYLIDRLAMRVGDEKDEDEADTVGASTLRAEHVKIGEDKIEFDFLGKDSVRWEKTLAISGVEKVLAKNLREFQAGKKAEEQIFPEVSSSQVNRFLSSIVPGLTAKVFRTFHATTTVETYLSKNVRLNGASLFEKERIAKLANLEAAIACNHKRTPPKTWAEGIAKREEALKRLRAAKPDVKKLEELVTARRATLAKLVEDRDKFEAASPDLMRRKKEVLARLEAKPEPEGRKAKSRHNKRLKAARQALREAKQLQSEKSKRYRERLQKAKLSIKRAEEARRRAKETYNERLEKAEKQLELVKLTRDYNLNTSLKNYIDPRVYRTWGERVGYDWTRLYTKTLQRKFNWVKEES